MKWPGIRVLYLAHRWIGIGTCLLFVLWFVSGLVMMYVPYPSLSPRVRLSHLSPIVWSRIHIGPDRALAIAGARSYPSDFHLEMLGNVPVYRLQVAGDTVTIDAGDGGRITTVDIASALKIAGCWSHANVPTLAGTIVRDQWTVADGYNETRPFYRILLNDAEGTQIYVSARNGEVVLQTTRRQRLWNWVGSVPHWIYFTALRRDASWWRQVVLWVSGTGIIGAVVGFWIGVLRLRFRKPYRGKNRTPYTDWKRWHHIAGLLGGIFLCTWMISGWLSVNPMGWLTGNGGTTVPMARHGKHQEPSITRIIPAAATGATGVTEVGFVWRGDKAMLVLESGLGNRQLVDAHTGQTVHLQVRDIIADARRLLPGSALIALARLDHEDDYWYSHHVPRHLPVLRAQFADAAHTWLYLDPQTGKVLLRLEQADRNYRWWFSALHTLDFPLLFRHRPAWDLVMWLMMLTGLTISASGCVIGWRRLRQ
ncbi:peptidase [Rhodanobacter spathiphylli]|uniref:PepSY-associated TM helix domain-containing protein n=1 Tax=Rhodanobacter spathiphylli B39 TaxID=1163407 RepID=I4W7C1_9GAMM|nr:peptidase [Rhodanobacter spathiphylli]EIL95362.1 PepSY-associated TM helix domain-containing protein [Rhodanobacter spathiphylli B39]